ncbi:MAG: glycosyltransferase family 4 protein [Cypionkella sp.]|uniref:glycosyltransferase family 4 protein n=1 Tax=Cypionkella sp. TaxID=2811411 RepID=UPI002ABC1553|nr:glycosyltransferase family 4 protein [Cypionkella sp.]MDZ4309945.1 glycosyltransferase family 4 protein [Cypionkella sp.]
MAIRADALAVDGEDMTETGRNAAIWYAQDGFDPTAKGINGRRVAGESFLKGFLRHADVDEFVLLAHGAGEIEPVKALAAELRPGKAVRHAPLLQPNTIAPVQTVFFPSPNYIQESWRRAAYGTGAWSICGITHTTSTHAVMQGFFDLRMAPVTGWDAVICTSQSVLSSVSYQMDRIDEHIRSHMKAVPPPRPMLPVIPLGVHCADFEPDVAKGAALREKLGAGPQDVVFTTIARLTPHEKFDPLPIYLAMQAAQRHLTGQKLFVAFCGQFRDDYSRKIFTEGAAKLMPDVGFALLDGASADDRKAVLSGADVFMFLIDNIQETFGLAPLEGMAAGLPLLVSDWDGMKDTVSNDVGFRITTRTLPGQYYAQEALRYQGGTDSYVQYCAATSALTELDLPELTARILQLARDPDLRRRMGAAGKARVQARYDWAQVVPQMQALWAEQDARRRAASAESRRYRADALPVAPSPMHLFGSYPTEQASFAKTRLVLADPTGRPSLTDVLATRNYQGMKRVFAAPEHIAQVLRAVIQAGPAGCDLAQLEAGSGLKGAPVERIAIWLLKYGFVRRA